MRARAVAKKVPAIQQLKLLIVSAADCITQIYYALLSGSKGVNLLDFADCETYKTTQQENPLLTPHAKAKGETWHETPTKQPVCKLI